MLQSGGLMPEVTVRELVTLVTKLHPKPEPIETTLKRAGIEKFADQRVDRPVRRPDPAGPVRAGHLRQVRADRAGRADGGHGRGDQAAVLGSMKGRGRRGTHAAVRHALPGGGRPGGGPDPGHQPGRLLADGTPAEIKERAGAKRLSFRLDQVDEPFLLGLPALVNLELRHDFVQIQSRTPTPRCTRSLTPATGRERSRSPASASSRPSWPSPEKTTAPAEPYERKLRHRRKQRRRTDMAGILALTQAELRRLSATGVTSCSPLRSRSSCTCW